MLIVAPIGRDAELMCIHLEAAGLSCRVCKDVEEACNELRHGAGVLLITEEALSPEVAPRLGRALNEQPAWSDVPIIILSGVPLADTPHRPFRELGRRTNVTVVDRPVRIHSL